MGVGKSRRGVGGGKESGCHRKRKGFRVKEGMVTD